MKTKENRHCFQGDWKQFFCAQNLKKDAFGGWKRKETRNTREKALAQNLSQIRRKRNK